MKGETLDRIVKRNFWQDDTQAYQTVQPLLSILHELEEPEEESAGWFSH